ncbi:MAG: hypothetical protein DCF19_22190 [Pseudanabaena frigida]|uniref:Host attachment protein n=1 Tax=Pseudanabaena frigida TaxID=945775 RepID=A0A2W4VUP7_9CYAN|nr:MAG: hypothetical protein DCF19_22190 [Pseudanabaena frigida]
MNTKVGLWIDHRKAIVVSVKEKSEETKEIRSEVEKQPRRSGDSPFKGKYEAIQVPADDRGQRILTEHLNIYYDAVIESIGDADSILIFGPSTAKNELKERLERKNLAGSIVGIETVDKMSDHQIAAKIREQFKEN